MLCLVQEEAALTSGKKLGTVCLIWWMKSAVISMSDDLFIRYVAKVLKTLPQTDDEARLGIKGTARWESRSTRTYFDAEVFKSLAKSCPKYATDA